jgi:hypothetical protein
MIWQRNDFGSAEAAQAFQNGTLSQLPLTLA